MRRKRPDRGLRGSGFDRRVSRETSRGGPPRRAHRSSSERRPADTAVDRGSGAAERWAGPDPERPADPAQPAATAGLEQSVARRSDIEALLGPALARIERFADLLAREGVTRGLIGPREVPRIWDRHLLNSAAVTPFLPDSGRVIDVGSGAGLPGVVLAAMRPDLDVVLLEPMARRTTWLEYVAAELELDNVTVRRGRAEEMHGLLRAEAVTARAVAALDKLVRWCLPLVAPGGVLLAMKGLRAAEELSVAARAIRRLGGAPGEILDAPSVPGVESTTIVRVRVPASTTTA